MLLAGRRWLRSRPSIRSWQTWTNHTVRTPAKLFIGGVEGWMARSREAVWSGTPTLMA